MKRSIGHGLDISDLRPLDLLRSLMKDQALSVGSAILRGKRELSKAHIKILAERFKVSPAAFIG